MRIGEGSQIYDVVPEVGFLLNNSFCFHYIVMLT